MKVVAGSNIVIRKRKYYREGSADTVLTQERARGQKRREDVGKEA
jgi:hypothetical protein